MGNLNTFTPEEMTIIYMAVNYLRNDAKEVQREFPALNTMDKKERAEYRTNKKILDSAEMVIRKIDMTFASMGIDVEAIHSGVEF